MTYQYAVLWPSWLTLEWSRVLTVHFNGQLAEMAWFLWSLHCAKQIWHVCGWNSSCTGPLVSLYMYWTALPMCAISSQPRANILVLSQKLHLIGWCLEDTGRGAHTLIRHVSMICAYILSLWISSKQCIRFNLWMQFFVLSHPSMIGLCGLFFLHSPFGSLFGFITDMKCVLSTCSITVHITSIDMLHLHVFSLDACSGRRNCVWCLFWHPRGWSIFSRTEHGMWPYLLPNLLAGAYHRLPGFCH